MQEHSSLFDGKQKEESGALLGTENAITTDFMDVAPSSPLAERIGTWCTRNHTPLLFKA